MKPRLVLKLFVTGRHPASERVIGQLCDFCEREERLAVEVAIVDILDRPEEAEAHRIVATPTLVRHFPPPVLRIVGELDDLEQVKRHLGLPDSTGLHAEE